ncbi:MAG: IS4 family transposase [Butyrivibrio hungatei]|nr:IS4 family transposase [Erysipelotrichaceae bacterium]MEE3473073.1 IS4 family transposase [Butyrivibrio hungatei]
MSKKSFSNKVFTVLDHKLMKLDKQKHEKGLLTSDVYFTRKERKLDFRKDMKILLSCGAASMKKELYEYFDYDAETVSLPGFIRSRSKIKEEAFKELMDVMNKAYPCNKKYKGYRLLAVDGSDLAIEKDENDKVSLNRNQKDSYSIYHLNCLYDILNHRYLDNIIQPLRKENEVLAMWTMAERYEGDKAIFIADRFYATFNNFERLKKTGHKFLIRVKDIHSGTSLLKSFKSLPKKGEFDEDVHITFTNRQTNFIRNNQHRYKIIMTNQRFDFLDSENHFYDADYRVVRIKIDGSSEEYESIITNLDRKLFPASKIKEIYKLRWDIEVSYRHLKYSVDLSALHSRRRDFIRQEIWARLVMFNISMIIIDYVQDRKLEKKNRDLEYKVNITMAIFFTKKYMITRKGGDPPDLENLIVKQILPVRSDRHYFRNVRSRGFVSFGYRFN